MFSNCMKEECRNKFGWMCNWHACSKITVSASCTSQGMYRSLNFHQKLLNSLSSSGLGVETCREQVGYPLVGWRKKRWEQPSLGVLSRFLCVEEVVLAYVPCFLISPRARDLKTAVTFPHNQNCVALSFFPPTEPPFLPETCLNMHYSKEGYYW